MSNVFDFPGDLREVASEFDSAAWEWESEDNFVPEDWEDWAAERLQDMSDFYDLEAEALAERQWETHEEWMHDHWRD